MYVWSDDPDKYSDAVVNFETVGETSNWQWDDVADQYYWHRWYKFQPDLNWDSPLVMDEMKKVLDFWYDMGVDALRLDAAPYLIEREGTSSENLPETHAIIQELRAYVDRRHPGSVFLPEANRYPDELLEYFGTPDKPEAQMAYHFPLMQSIYEALAAGSAQPVKQATRLDAQLPPGGQFATFLRNHDELTLSLIDQPKRAELIRHYAPDPEMEILGGVRRRFAPLMGNDERTIDFVNASLFAKPGTPIVYYGDEIGMGDNVSLWDRNSVRTPMQWTGDQRTGGYSEADPESFPIPVVDSAEFNPSRVNVETQLGDDGSRLRRNQRMTAAYDLHPALQAGSEDLIDTGNDAIYAAVRSLGDDRVLVLENWSKQPQTITLDRSAVGEDSWQQFFGSDQLNVEPETVGTVTIQPRGFHWLTRAQ
jgi:maltose alpha-D-glucosyltransferase/alpha-amylase